MREYVDLHLPELVYIVIFLPLALAFGWVFYHWAVTGVAIMHPYFAIQGVVGAVGLCATAITALCRPLDYKNEDVE